MLNALIRWSLANRALVLALTAAFLVWGGLAITELPVDVLPDLTAPSVTVVVEHPSVAPADMEQLVTIPLETAMNGAPGVRRVRSATAVGVTIVWVDFEWGIETYRARQTVAERADLAASSLPPGAGRPVLGPTASIMGEVLFVALTSDRHDPIELRTTADTVIRRRLLAVPGVAQVVPIGGGRKQFQVLLAPERLRARGVSLSEVREALAAGSARTSAGFQTRGGREYLIQGMGRFANLEEIGSAVVVSRNAVPVLVRDVGEVRVGEALKRGEGSLNGERAVVIGIRKQPAVNTLGLTSQIDQALDEIAASLPSGMRIHRDVFRQADFIETAIGNLLTALAFGGALVAIAVILFLANIRASLITLFAIPFSLFAAFRGLDALGLTINGMTLGGLAIAIGELVDDAVVDVENVFRRLRQNASLPAADREPALRVVYRASSEIRRPIVFATLIVMLVFVPLLYLEGVEGSLLRPLGFAYVTALLGSLVVALTVTPVLCSLMLPRARAVAAASEPRLIRLLKRAYVPALRWCLDHTLGVVACSIILLGAAALFLGSMGRSFLPAFNEGSLSISAVSMPGTSLEESDRHGAALERSLLMVPEVALTARRTGRAELDEHLQGVESAEIDVRLALQDRPIADVVADVRDRASLIPGTNISIGQPISHRIDHMLSGTRSNVAVKVFGDDLQTLRALALQVENVMREVPGVVDLVRERQADIPTVTARFRRAALARHGLPAGTAAKALETAFLGNQVGTVLEGMIAFPLVVRLQIEGRDHMDAIRNTMIDTPSGARIPLSAIAEIREDRSPNVISRESVQRKIVVSCNIAGGDLRGVVDDIRSRLGQSVQLPPGYRIEYGGQFESEARATRRIMLLSGLVIVGIFVLLGSAFRSWGDAAVVMGNLPFALIGGAVGAYLAGGVISVASLIGFITLFGIAVRNGIMLVSHFRHLQEEEGVASFREAVLRGATERLAPILMTAVTTGIALLPVAAGLGETGSEFHAPLALVVTCGLVSSTLMNLLVVPAAYWRFRKPRASSQQAFGMLP